MYLAGANAAHGPQRSVAGAPPSAALVRSSAARAAHAGELQKATAHSEERVGSANPSMCYGSRILQ